MLQPSWKQLVAGIRTKLGFGDNEVLLLLALALNDFVSKKLFEALAHLAFVDGRDIFDGLGSVGEAVDGRELEQVASTLSRVERLVEVLCGLELGRVGNIEEAEAYGGLEKHLDHCEERCLHRCLHTAGRKGWCVEIWWLMVVRGGLCTVRLPTKLEIWRTMHRYSSYSSWYLLQAKGEDDADSRGSDEMTMNGQRK